MRGYLSELHKTYCESCNFDPEIPRFDLAAERHRYADAASVESVVCPFRHPVKSVSQTVYYTRIHRRFPAPVRLERSTAPERGFLHCSYLSAADSKGIACEKQKTTAQQIEYSAAMLAQIAEQSGKSHTKVLWQPAAQLCSIVLKCL